MPAHAASWPRSGYRPVIAVTPSTSTTGKPSDPATRRNALTVSFSAKVPGSLARL